MHEGAAGFGALPLARRGLAAARRSSIVRSPPAMPHAASKKPLAIIGLAHAW